MKEVRVRKCDEKLYAVVWLKNTCGAQIGSILVVEPILISDEILCDKKGIHINSLAIFHRKCDAISFIGGNDEWGVMKIQPQKES